MHVWLCPVFAIHLLGVCTNKSYAAGHACRDACRRHHAALLQGMLAIGAAILGSGHVIGVDVDSDALELALDNSLEFENLEVRWIQCRPCTS